MSRFGWVGLFVLVVMGCTNLHLPNQQPMTYEKKTWAQRAKQLRLFDHWQIDGAFSMQGLKQYWIASYHWQQRARSYELRMHSSLGIYEWVIKGEPGKVIFQQSKGKYTVARTPEALMQTQLGWYLPLSYLFYWIRGLPAPHVIKQQFDLYGHLVYLEQAGWQVHFSHYMHHDRIDLPQILQLTHDRFKVRIVVKHW